MRLLHAYTDHTVTDEPRAGTVTDPAGLQVVLLARIWEGKITRDHPHLVGHLEAVMETVARPDHVEPDARPARTRFYRRDAGPSRWAMRAHQPSERVRLGTVVRCAVMRR